MGLCTVSICERMLPISTGVLTCFGNISDVIHAIALCWEENFSNDAMQNLRAYYGWASSWDSAIYWTWPIHFFRLLSFPLMIRRILSRRVTKAVIGMRRLLTSIQTPTVVFRNQDRSCIAAGLRYALVQRCRHYRNEATIVKLNQGELSILFYFLRLAIAVHRCR